MPEDDRMNPSSPCAVAADTKLETPEGPLAMRTVARTPCSVLTRTAGGAVRFHMTREARALDGTAAVVKITLEGGLAFRVGPEQVLLRPDGAEVRAADLRPGDDLASVFAFPPGYVYRTDGGVEAVSTGGVRVADVRPDGEAERFSFRVHQTGTFAFSSGVLGKAEGS
jgi:hypothetical protein